MKGAISEIPGLRDVATGPTAPSTAERPLDLLLVADQPGITRRVRAMLADAEGQTFQITAAGRISEALCRMRQHRFDAVLLDLRVPDSQDDNAVQILTQAFPEAPILVLTDTEDETSGPSAIRSGAQDYLVKEAMGADLLCRSIRFAIQRQRIEHDLLVSQERFQTLVENLPDGVLLYDGTGITFANSSALHMLGATTAQELLGKRATEFLTSAVELGVAEQLQRVVNEGFRFPQFVEGEYHPLGGGARFECEFMALPLNHAMANHGQIILRDITSRKQAEKHLRLATTVFEASAEGMMVSDAQGHIEMVNQAFTDITGFTGADVTGWKARFLNGGCNGSELCTEMARGLRGKGHWRGDIRARRKSGEHFVARLTLSAIRDDNRRLTALVGVFSDITEEKEQEAAIEHLANHDPLTGLPNRRLLFDRLNQALADRPREPSHRNQVALLFVDLDDFKQINDVYGHETGDRLLNQIALRIRQALRQGDTVARMGGDEFLILLKHLPNEQTADDLAEKIVHVINEPVAINGGTVSVGASIGIVLAPKHGDTTEALLSQADRAMYRSKEAGKGRCTCAN